MTERMKMTTVREARIRAAFEALDRTLIPFGDGLSTGHNRLAAEAVVDALFTDHSADHLTIPTSAERELAEYLPGD